MTEFFAGETLIAIARSCLGFLKVLLDNIHGFATCRTDSQLTGLLVDISATQLSEVKDAWSWSISNDGNFQVSITIRYIDSTRPIGGSTSTVWDNCIPRKPTFLDHIFLESQYEIHKRRVTLQMLIILTTCCAISNASESDISCLRSIRESLEDPHNDLVSWDFGDFVGVDFSNINGDYKVLNIRLSGMGLRGPFPVGIKNCTSLTGLDLSGPIPRSIAKCSSINVLKLDHNQLTGQIPQELSTLYRIKEFNVAENKLWGPVPPFPNVNISANYYSGNSGLCGRPLKRCMHVDIFFIGFAVGFPLSTILTMFCYFSGLSISDLINKLKTRKRYLVTVSPEIPITEESCSQDTEVTAMKKFICRLTLVKLEMATNNFDVRKVIGYGNMGIMYKAVFPNGLMLAVKRLHKFEKEFLLEIEILGKLRHTNILPLLSFYFEQDKKFLIYKYMCNGTLHQWLNSRQQVEGKKMGWTLRFRIALGIAGGLAWLHHNNVMRVAHLKINSKCILLDDKFEPKISNFGKSQILMNTSGMPSSCLDSLVPDSSPSPYNEDIYCFGILLLEIAGAKEPSKWINSSREVNVIIDEGLMGQGFDEEIYEIIGLAERCIRTQKDGVKNMLQVYQAMCAISLSRNKISVNL
ncbi:probably inactive leucine-rich repeat receptor-like protein kinase At5g48380 [Rutidosis leptorrhynchoides]|uniref:probably inactive leucine-rich repeat receptor-like protein kinase At5g48380 n=1 Tax=Rutidosis leptorrhynchoides TaxID=125765 RepID=UPI003A99B58C